MYKVVLILIIFSSWVFAKTVNSPQAVEDCYKDGYFFEEKTTDEGEKQSRYIGPGDLEPRCTKSAIEWVTRQPPKTDTLKQVAESIGRNHAWSEALPVFQKLIDVDKKSCRNDNLLYAVNLAFSQTKESNVQIAQKIAFEKCWSELKEGILQEFAKETGYYRAHTCKALTERKVLSSLQQKNCERK